MFAMSRGALVAAIAAAVSVVAITVLAWRAAKVAIPVPPERPVAAAPAPSPERSAAVPDAPPPAPPATAVSGTSPPPQATTAEAAKPAPSFDVVRVEPSGETVIAGRAAPGTVVTLLASGKPAGTATTDSAGQFVIIPQAFGPGSHELALSQKGPQGEQASTQSVVVAVPGRGGGEVVVALAEPGRPTQILSDAIPRAADPTAARPQAGAINPASAPPPSEVMFRAVEAEQGGGFYASGQAAPGAKLQIYMNDGHIAEVIADDKGQWSLRVSRGMTPGQYTVRADQIDPASGKVTKRAEVPFAYAAPRVEVAAAPAANVAAPNGSKPASDATPPATAPVAPAGVDVQPRPAPSVPVTATTVAPTPAAPAADDAAPPPRTAAAAAPESAPAATPVTPDRANVTVDQVITASVVRGDSLWRISRRMLGKGVRYTQIYDANTSQIRDPRRIYPGQILVVPGAKASP